MEAVITQLDSLTRAKYFSGVALVSIFYDHLLTLHSEISTIWANPNRDYFPKLTYVMNRYYTEAIVIYVAYVLSGTASLNDSECRRFIWVFALTATVFIGTTQFFILFRVYHSWDKRKHLVIILLAGFTAFITASTTLAIITVADAQDHVQYNPALRTCIIFELPSILPYMLGSLLGFHLFLILLALYNAFERPHRTHADIIDSLHSDGARLFIVLLRLLTVIMSVVGSPADCFGVLNIVWALDSIITSRIHMRVEGLKFA
ncbi:hypothetical protein BDP27DRAFT_1354894, partial [Rhodocollybia butyracea]